MTDTRRHWRPMQSHAVISEMRQRTNATGEIFYTGRVGVSVYMLTPIRHPEPDGPTHVLMIAETDRTRAPETISVAEIAAAEDGR
jgi:hypothetical protein